MKRFSMCVTIVYITQAIIFNCELWVEGTLIGLYSKIR